MAPQRVWLRTGSKTINSEQIERLANLLGEVLRSSAFPGEVIQQLIVERSSAVKEQFHTALERMICALDVQYAADLGEEQEADGSC